MRTPEVVCTLFLAASASLSTGCVGPAAREAAHAAAPAMVEGAVEGIADEGNQRKLAQGIDEESVEIIAERLSGKIVDGTMKSLSDPERRELVAKTLRDVRVPIDMEGGMDVRVATIDRAAVAGAVDAALEKALGHVDEDRARALVRGVVDEAVRTAFTAARDEMQHAGPDAEDLASLPRSVSKQATLGFQDAVDEVRRARDAGQAGPGEGSVLWAASRAAESGNTILDVWKISLIALGVVLMAGFAWAFRQHRAHRRELLQRDEALALLTKKVEETERGSGSPPGRATDATRQPSHEGRPHFA